MGFDEILLDNAGYPTRGNLEYIQTGSDYDATQFASVIGDFYTKAAQAATAGVPSCRRSPTRAPSRPAAMPTAVRPWRISPA